MNKSSLIQLKIIWFFLFLVNSHLSYSQDLVFVSIDFVLNESDTLREGQLELENCSFANLRLAIGTVGYTADITLDSDSIYYDFRPDSDNDDLDNTLWSLEFDPFFIGTGENQFDEAKEGMTCDKTGNIYLVGEEVTRWNNSTNQTTQLGALPSSMYARGDITFRNGQLYLSSVNHTLVEVDLDNPMNSTVVMNFPPGIGDVHGLATINIGCDSLVTYAAASQPFGGSTIYRIDFDNWILEEICTYDFFITGLASYDECKLPDCLLNIDLDEDNSSSATGNNFQSTTVCTFPTGIADSDITFQSDISQIDSITLLLSNSQSNGEYLSLSSSSNIDVFGEGTDELLFVNNGSSSIQDFEQAIGNVLYNNDDLNPTSGQREINIVAYTGSYQSSLATSYIPIGEADFDPVFIVEEISCHGSADASILSEPQGGTAPYDFLWSTNEPGTQINSLDTGQYYLTITDALGCTDIESIYIDQPEVLEVVISNSGFDTICNESGVLLANPNGGTAPYSYLWSDGFEEALNDQLNSGSYTVTIEDENGCETEISFTLEEGNNVLLNIEEYPCFGEMILIDGESYISDTSFCLSYVLPNGCDSIRCYQLDFYEENSTNFYDEICHGDSLLIFGDYYSNDTMVSLVMTDINGCDSILLFDLNILDSINIQFETNGILCNEGEVNISVNGFEEYEWSNGEIGSMITVDESGNYGLTVTDNNGCTHVSATLIEESELIVYWTATNPSCYGVSDGVIQIDSIIDGEAPYLTSLNGGPLLLSLSYDNLPSGDHTVKVISSNSCEYLIEVTLGEPAEILIQQSETSVVLASGSSIDVSIETNFNTAEILWSPSDYLGCVNCFENTISASSSIIYEITVTTPNGCSAMTTFNVEVEDAKIFVPNVFSPNGDFTNDHLKVYGSPLVEQVIDFTIISRNGHVVFNNKNFPADESQQGWDGTFRNKKAQQGVYVVYVEYEDTQGNIRKEIYSVTLLR